MQETAYCRQTQQWKFEGEGDSGAHQKLIVLRPGQYSMVMGGDPGPATIAVKLIDHGGNEIDWPNGDQSGAANFRSGYPQTITQPGMTLKITAEDADETTKLAFQLGKSE